MICNTNFLKNPLSHHDTPIFSVDFTFELIIAGSDTINCQIFQSWFYLKVELGKRINMVSDWKEGRTQSKWQSQRVMVQPSGRIGLTSVRRRLHLMLQSKEYIPAAKINTIQDDAPTLKQIRVWWWRPSCRSCLLGSSYPFSWQRSAKSQIVRHLYCSGELFVK